MQWWKCKNIKKTTHQISNPNRWASLYTKHVKDTDFLISKNKMQKLNFPTNKAGKKLGKKKLHSKPWKQQNRNKVHRIQAKPMEKAYVSKAKSSPHKIPKLTLAPPVNHKQETKHKLKDQNTISKNPTNHS